MLTVEHFARIRQARRDGLTIRDIADQLGHSTKTVVKALAQPEPVPYAHAHERPAPTFGPFRPIVEAILTADETAPRKQRHTAAQIFRRLQTEYGYTGQYDQIRRYLKDRRLDRRETFIPLDHPPGHRAEADFGHIHVDFPEGRRHVPVLLVTWSYSNCPFAIALPTERTEAILHGLVEAFAFFGCVPRELWWDNPRTVVSTILQGRDRRLHPRYAALASHYTFTPQFCLPATPTEKPKVEHRVFDLQRRWATPVPRVADHAALNAHLLRCCQAEQQRVSGDQAEAVGVRFAHDRAAALPTPARSFDACVLHSGQVDKYQTVRFDRNAYSVPRRWAFRPITVKGYIDRVEAVAEGQVVACHVRCYGKGERVLDPLHFLVTLEHKPAALDHAPVYRDWRLPPAFATLRQRLEAKLGRRAGTRHFIRVLQLLARHPVARVEEAIETCCHRDVSDVALIQVAVEQLATHGPLPAALTTGVPIVTVPPPDLTHFNRLLPLTCKGDSTDDPTDGPAVAGELEATETADHAGGMREVGPRGGIQQ
jgi:transposase